VIPLFLDAALGREYVNRVLAMGWIPGLLYTPDVASRPFVTAAYEIATPRPSTRYQPDWRAERRQDSNLRRQALDDGPRCFLY